jgi:hypothetical protein
MQPNGAFGLRQWGTTGPLLMTLQFLDFDLNEDAHGTLCWDALASPAPVHNAALLAEVSGLLDRLHALHGAPGPLDEGHGWDCDLQVQTANAAPLAWDWQGERLAWSSPAPLNSRLSLGLCLSGGPDLAHTLAQEVTPT